MKRITLLITFLFSILSIYAEHEYIPLLSPTSEWVELTYKAYVRYAISDTATINNKEYCVISSTEMLLPEKEIHQSNSKIYIREEDKRVYLYDEYAPEEEYLLFDFGAKAGDKIVVNNTTNEDWVIAIDRVETINLNGIERNMLHVSYICNNEDLVTNDTWIEGIGSTQFSPFINIIRWGGTGLGYFHYFYDYNTDFIYPEDREVIDFSDVSTIPTDASSITLHREGETVVAVFPATGVGETITLYDTTGRIVAVESVREDATSTTIDIAHLPQGVYIARMNSGASCKVVL